MNGEHKVGDGAKYLPLDLETREILPTDAAAHHLNRRPQTLRIWASRDSGPLRPVRVWGRLGWPTAKIRALLGVQK